jgi:hypothetical protein
VLATGLGRRLAAHGAPSRLRLALFGDLADLARDAAKTTRPANAETTIQVALPFGRPIARPLRTKSMPQTPNGLDPAGGRCLADQ